MDHRRGDTTRREAAEELILRTISAHADSLLRTARRHSICVDDAQDAYQRAIEIFMGHADRLDAAHAPGWLHVVVKREAQAIRRSRQRMLTTTEVDLDAHVAQTLPTADERVLRFDRINRSAEALKRLKPQELRALWLRAQGHSYSEIEAITGWSYTKVNRCLTEGRRSFLARYRQIESGEECRRWMPVLSAFVDGEATPKQIRDLRPHLRNCPGCRATLRDLQDSSTPLAAVLPVPLAVVLAGTGDHVTSALTRLYEGIAGGMHERVVHSLTKTQALVEASAAGKVAAVAASAAAVAGGGYASVEQVIDRPAVARSTAKAHVRHAPAVRRVASLSAPVARVTTPTLTPVSATSSPSARLPERNEFGATRTQADGSGQAPEFRSHGQGLAVQAWSASSTRSSTSATQSSTSAKKSPARSATPSSASSAKAAPEFASSGATSTGAASSGVASGTAAPEFGP